MGMEVMDARECKEESQLECVCAGNAVTSFDTLALSSQTCCQPLWSEFQAEGVEDEGIR
jgi:hypothetical protein